METYYRGWVNCAQRVFENHNLCLNEIFVGEARSILTSDNDSRLPATTMREVWDRATTLAGNLPIGLEMGREIQPTHMHALGFALWASNNVADVLDRICRYSPFVSTASAMILGKTAHSHTLFWQNRMDSKGQAWAHDSAVDSCFSVIAHVGWHVSQNRVGPKEVHFMRARPLHEQRYQDLFRCPVFFNSTMNCLIYDRAESEHSQPGANSDLALHNETLMDRLMAQLEAEDIELAVSRKLKAALGSVEPTPQHIADELFMSVRSLQRYLLQAGTNFSDLLTKARQERSFELLHQPDVPLTNFPDALGFSSQSAFNRAFKRWQGISPNQYRRQILRFS
ncbi:AraC family transcriptional regulator [Ferrimonas aestuarii]|uniref:AraC family transcriptional regulator n=1 Tax=Ferrimonas aestuarii TaxID=2569539 RepID=A0A4V5NWG9_9GAMM|nr:AraC family transcriptional regulator [Ferrimonas aestuarii]TKB57512.1 AraC family transcriptional regulator [Ferrimonas aestuarii]